MRLEPIGIRDDLEEGEYEPITIPIVGYTNDLKEVTTEIDFRAAQALGTSLDLIRTMSVNEKGETMIPIPAILEFLDAAILEESREDWDDLLHSDEINVEQGTLVTLYQTLAAQYTRRPTKQRSGSHNGRTTPRKTSRAAASAKKSTSPVSV